MERENSRLNPETSVNIAEWLVLGLTVLWLFYSAFTVQIEYYDGWDTIWDTHYLLGDHPYFLRHRCPTISILLLPAGWIVHHFDLLRYDPRPYHVLMALYHAGALIGFYVVFRRIAPTRLVALISTVAGVLTFVFFSYAPFLSHDLLPGFLLFFMLILTESFCEDRNVWKWALLVILGAASALIKQTYGVFWFAILVSRAIPYITGTIFRKTDKRDYALLAAGSVASATIYWLVSSWVLVDSFRDVAFLVRPYEQLQVMLQAYGEQGRNWWIYIRNFHYYGVLTTMLLVPGIWVRLRGDRRSQSFALTWIVCVIFMHLLRAYEFRYIAFLMPVSAFLLLPVLQRAIAERVTMYIVLVILSFDVYRSTGEALRLRDSFYTDNRLWDFAGAVQEPDGKNTLNVIGGMLTFKAPLSRPFAGDPYHRLFHADVVMFRHITAGPCVRVMSLKRLGNILAQGYRATFYFPKDLPPDAKTDYRHELYACLSNTIAVAPYKLIVQDGKTPVLKGNGLDLALSNQLAPVLVCDDKHWHPLRKTDVNTYAVQGMTSGTVPSKYVIRAFRIVKMVRY